MKIYMLETRRGSEDGLSVAEYEKGRIYDVRDTMGRYFLNNGWAKEARDDGSIMVDILVLPPNKECVGRSMNPRALLREYHEKKGDAA